jgi:metal-responsive CopG/Arc/MetJ family transcriptional regulator
MEKKLIRVQLDMPEERVKDLENIMAKTGVSTRKDVFENALALFEWAVNERMSGRKIASLDEKEDGFRELLMPALASVKNEAKNKNGITK